ncbi:hypothetical protein C1646_634073, partial [Rhizophagus diaphanus]
LSLLYESGEGVDKNEEEAFKLIKKLAEKNHINAIFTLGNYYKKGIGTKKDKNMAFQLYKKTAEYENYDALYELSLLYCSGEGVNKNEEMAFKLIKKLAEKDAFSQLGCYYYKGIGTEININKAIELHKIDEIIKMNDIQHKISKYYIKKDARRAFNYYKESAKKGHSKAQFKLGMCYHFGIGTKIHKKKAFHLYTKSTISAKEGKEGHNVAQYELSILYETGEGVNKDEKKSFEIIEELADKGYVNAQHRLGYYYEKGIGTDVNILKALELYHTAAENGITEAIKSSSSLLFKLGEKIIKGETKAFEIVELYQTAKKNGNLKAKMSLERLLYELRDKRKAFDIVKELADKGDENAQHRLGYYYEKGIGTHINILKARELYTMAVINKNVEALKSLNDLILNHGT